MSINCDVLVPEDFLLAHVKRQDIRDKYRSSCFHDYVWSHPLLRFCPGKNCTFVIKATKPLAKRCVCISCKVSFW